MSDSVLVVEDDERLAAVLFTIVLPLSDQTLTVP
jgi:hypothetical protein